MFRWHREGCPRIAQIYGANIHSNITEAELRLAARYDLIVGGINFGDTDESRRKVNDHIKRLHEMNPRIIVLHYITGACEQRLDNPRFDRDCFLRTPGGEVITGWPGSHMLNLSKAKTVEAMAKSIIDSSRGSAADGMYIDCMGGNFDTWCAELQMGKNVDVDADEDGVADEIAGLDRQWVDGKEQILKLIREEVGVEPYILVNGGMEHRYAKPYADGNLFEGILDHVSIPNLYSKYSFEQILEDCHLWSSTPSGRQNCSYIDITPKFDIDFNIRDTLSPIENSRILLKGYESLQLMRFGLAMTLLTDIHYTFQLHTRALGQYWWYQEYDLPIGNPLGGCYKHEDGSWRRDYENAVVVANLNYHEIKPHFESEMRDSTSSQISKDFLLSAQDGRIYMRMG